MAERTVGRPAKYQNKEELQLEIDRYFYEATHDETGNEREKHKPISVTGLAFYLGFADRQSITDYQSKDEYSFTIKRAKLQIEQYLEEKLLGNNVTGVIFNLKNNYGWKDKQEIESTGGVNVNIMKFSENQENEEG